MRGLRPSRRILKFSNLRQPLRSWQTHSSTLPYSTSPTPQPDRPRASPACLYRVQSLLLCLISSAHLNSCEAEVRCIAPIISDHGDSLPTLHVSQEAVRIPPY